MSVTLRVNANTGNRAHPLKDRRDDLYETPPAAVEALLLVEDVPARIWEPACGPGSITRVLRASGRDVFATDLVDYSSPDQDASGRDFLMELRRPDGFETILTNPPYKLANEFVAHSLSLCPKVIMLLRLAFLESNKRIAILDSGSLARVHVFRKRLPMMHRGGWTGEKVGGGMIAFAWFVWDRAHSGPTELHRISWESSRLSSVQSSGATEA